ncbi:proline dehydrogenase family protein [Peredibacter sp. HCB2-198]|uniref:proline dehydrogenase family protein n=1 Tax=Peredibacter sp. HCB2-198 TaxID=3383025 RepID=UPI0038B54EA8
MNLKGVPVVKKRVVGQWQISFYEEFDSVLFPGGNLHSEVEVLISFVTKKGFGSGFRREVVINAFPFLCAVRPEEKSIYIGTRRLSRELALLKLHEVNPVLIDQDIEKLFFALKEHVEKISTISPTNFPSEIEWVSVENNLPQFWNKEQWKDVDDEAKVILKQLVKKVGDYHSSAFEKVSDYGLTLTAQYDLIRVHLLKFLAVLPSLDHDKNGTEVKRNLLESLRRLGEDSRAISMEKKRGTRQLPLYLTILFGAAFHIAQMLPANILAAVVRYMVRMMAKRFIAGESINTSHATLRDLRETNREATLDQLGELVVSAKEADEYFEKVLQLIHGLKQHVPKGEKNKAGILKAHVSIKVSALSHDFRPQAFEATYAKVAPRLRRILQEAEREEVFIQVDAEHYHYRDLVLAIYEKVLLETPELKNYDQTGIVVQAYLRDGSKHLMDVVELAKKRKHPMRIRLVKGAYWDAETIEGEAHQFTPPQFLNKEESDLHFRQLAYLALKNHEHIHLAVGSHNLQDHAFVESMRTLRFPQAPVIEHQCLHMTYEALSHGLAKMGWPTRNYMPIGNLLVGMAYLVRRIMENSSQVGVLSIMRSHQKASGLISPVEVHASKKKAHTIQFDSFITQLKSDFAPARPLRLFLKDEREALEKSIHELTTKIAANQDTWKNSSETKVVSSSRPDLVIGTYKASTNSEAIKTVEEAEAALMSSWWSKQSLALYRVSVLLKAADIMLLKRNSLSALMMYEAGKTMTEALADVDEAIDFINFYARQEISLQLSHQKLTNRGVITVIAPWNFPLAIPCGMTVAPLVAGNAVILKPAEQTPLIAIELYNILIEAGVPKEILHLIQGDGEVVGAPLVTHPKTAGIVFTGSKGVGQWIYRHAGQETIQHYYHQIPMQKKVITEMGGKNAIIVTNNCELDETISGILYAAFGHSGQKCSAASRVIVHKEVKDALVARLMQAIRDLKVGEALDPSTAVNPLITREDQERVKKAIEEAKDEAIRSQGKILIDRSFEKLPGFCVGPALFELPAFQARKKDSWAQREIFGPVIHLTEYESMIEAVELFNGTEYALTGGIYSQSQDDIDFLLRFLRAGNIYVNRPNTGARVAIEPFGGFKLSGTGPKAGGTDYVKEFHFILSAQDTQPHEGKWAPDSGYALMTPRPSLISTAGRVSRFEHFANGFIDQYELFMGTVNEKEKAQLLGFVNWVKGNLGEYLNGHHLNFVIPGQLSYNDKSIIKDAGLFVTVSARPSLKSVHYLFGALALGCGVSIACLTEESYKTWKGILDLAWKAGFSKTNIDITFMSQTTLSELLKEPHYSFIYAGHYVQYRDLLYKGVLEGKSLSETMRLILSEVDGVSLEPSQVLDQFVWTRSLAINTMRHGAPLELNA